MAIKKVWIDEGCIACNLCEEIAEEVFEVQDSCEVKDGADLSSNEDEIKEAAEGCPVEVIKIEE